MVGEGSLAVVPSSSSNLLQGEVCLVVQRRLLLVACLASSNRLLGEACSAGPRHQPPLTKGINYSQRYHSTKGMNSKLP